MSFARSPEAAFNTHLDVAKEFLKTDVLIAVPVAKSHSATGGSLSMKGMMGLIYNRGIMHRMDLHEPISRFNYHRRHKGTEHLAVQEVLARFLEKIPSLHQRIS